MPNVNDIVNGLRAYFPVTQIKWRVGAMTGDKLKGMALAYLDARDVMERLDEVCGPFNWALRHEVAADGGKTTAHIGIRDPDTGEWVFKSDGAGESDVEAEKGSYSDSTKRAAVQWGIGRYLYDVNSPWVSLNEKKQIIAHEYEKLYACLPNNKGGLTTNTLSGLSKTPAKFWDASNYDIVNKLPAKFKGSGGIVWGDQETIVWLIDNLPKFIDKAPDRAALAKLQADNSEWMNDQLDTDTRDNLNEGFRVRAEQFDHLQGMKK